MYDLAIVGLARDCRGALVTASRHVDLLREHGLRVRVLVGEDSSLDDTRRIAGTFAEVVDTTPTGQLGRLDRLARAREKVRQAYLDGPRARAVLVVDFDGPFLSAVEPSWLRNGTERLERGEEFALGATSRPYYDLLAFESDEKFFADLSNSPDARSRNPFRLLRYRRANVYPQQAALTSVDEISCISSFNGACLYLDGSIESGSYFTDPPAGLCDHVVLNRGLARHGARMTIDPSLVVEAPSEHVEIGTVPFLLAWARSTRPCRWVVRSSRATSRGELA